MATSWVATGNGPVTAKIGSSTQISWRSISGSAITAVERPRKAPNRPQVVGGGRGAKYDDLESIVMAPDGRADELPLVWAKWDLMEGICNVRAEEEEGHLRVGAAEEKEVLNEV